MRKTILTALGESDRLGHAEVLPEDLLLAITRDRACAAMILLERCGLSDARVRAAAEERVDKSRPCRGSRLSSGAMHVLDLAIAEARRLEHRQVGTEHLLLGMLLAKRGSMVLASLGVRHAEVERSLKRWLAEGSPRARPRAGLALPMPAGVRRVVTRAVERTLKWPNIGYQIFFRRSLAHPGFITHPYRHYRWLRDHAPVRYDPLAALWVVTRYDDVASVLKDPRFGKETLGLSAESLPPPMAEQLSVSVERWLPAASDTTSLQMLFADPPRHTRIRAIFAKAFTPKALSRLRDRVQQVTDRFLDKVQASGEMDLIRDLAYPLPTVIIAELLGFPAEDFERFKKWSDDFAGTLGINQEPGLRARAAESLNEMRQYMLELIKRRMADRNSDDAGDEETVLGTLMSLPVSRSDISPEELFANCVLLLAAGHETTTNLIGNGMLALLNHPDQLDLLRNKPSLVENAIEEMLRYDSPVQWTNRVPAHDIEIGGVPIPRGETLLLALGSANRDERRFENADRFDIERDASKHVAFGGGIHFCLGAALARMEGEIAIASIVQRLKNPRLAIRPRKLRWDRGLVFRGVKSLPMQFDTI